MFDVGIKSIQAEIKDNTLVISSSEPLRVLSSAVLNGGLIEACGIINVQVPEGSGQDKNDVHWNAEQFLNTQIRSLGLPNNVVALMTAANMKNVVTSTKKNGKTSLALFVTGGKTVAVTAGEPAASKNPPKLGTINIILLVDGNMTEGCMVEAHKTITEAKTVALKEYNLRSQFSGDLATGTLTDTIAVACTKKGELIRFAGTFTLIGELIAQCVRECVKTAIYKQEGLVSGRSLKERLTERGIEIEKLISLFNQTLPVENAKSQQLKKKVEQTLSDRKIVGLILASLRYDEDLRKGLIPEHAEKTIDQDIFEEIVTVAIRNYLSDKCISDSECLRLITNEKSLGPLTNSVLNAILKNAYSKIG